MLKFLLVVSASVLFACGAPAADPSGDIVYDPCEPVVITPSAELTAPQREGITAAISLWRGVGLDAITLDPQAGTQRVPIRFIPTVAMLHGIYQPKTGEVQVNTRMAGRELDITIAHELGHALGLPHILASERVSVMNPGNSTIAPTPDDERQLRVRWSCLSKP